jgi:hypothetical protein
METPQESGRSSAEVLSEADRVLAELETCVKDAKREKRRARRLRRIPVPELRPLDGR